MKIKVLIALLFLVVSYTGHAQCGTETFTVVDWCENSYAEWTITNPDPLAQYHWYEPVYAADGVTVTDTIDRGYGASSDGTHFVSPYRYTTPAGPLTTGWDNRKFWYVKEKLINFSLGLPATGNHTIAPATGYSMNFTSTLETNINFVTVPIFSYYISPTLNFYVQIQIDTKYSQIYYFNAASLTSVGSNVFLLRVPVGITTQAGTHVITVVTNPASPKAGTVAIGTNQVELAMLNSATTFPITSTNGINITGSSNTGKSMIYKWETSTYCPYKFSPDAKKETNLTKCCTPVTNPVIVSSSNPIIISGTDNSILTVTSYTSLSNYFQWYKDNSPIAGEGGYGNITMTATAPGSYSVREVQDPTRLSNVSCYSEVYTLIQERALFAKVNNPKTSYCVGDKVNIEAYGTSIGNVSWSPVSLAASPMAKKTDVILSTTGTLTFTATADLFPDDVIVNGNFEAGNTGFTTSMSYTTPPNTPGTNNYTINDYVPNQSYWNKENPFNAATQTRGDGKFFISDAPTSAGSLLWKQTATVNPNKNYTFSIDHVNISWNADPSNTSRIADNDLEFDVFVNGVIYGSYKTDGRGEYIGVGRWKTDKFIWNSGGATQAVIEIKTKNTSLPGYDFGFDNIKFGGPQTQTATVSVGPIADCFDVIPSQSACVGATKTLTAKAINTVTNEEVGVIDRWEAPVGTVVGSDKTITVSPLTTTTYTVYAVFPSSNLIQNGDFELGANGFNYGSANNLYNLTTSPGPGSIAILKNPQTETSNTAYANMGDHTSGTGKMLLVDPGSADGNIISYNFNANANQNYLFSLWAANAVNFSQNPNGISASLSFIINGPGVTNLQISSIDLPRNNNWIQLSDVWKPTTTGAYTLTVRAKGDATLAPIQSAATGLSINGGNDYVLDDIVLAEPTGKVYSKTIVVTPCVSCTKPTAVAITTPAAATVSICEGASLTLSGSVTVPTASTATGGFKYSWIKVGATPATDAVLQTAAITLVANTAATVPNYTGITAATAANAGKYILRVEDGTTGSTACFLDDTLTLSVIAKPTITSSVTGSLCSDEAQNYAITSSAPSSYAWTRAAVTGITNLAGSGTTASITEILTNSTTAPVNVVYKITPTSTTGSCVGTTFDYTVTVNPKPVITSATTGSICSGVAPTYTITSNVASSYVWTRALVTNITTAANSGTTAAIAEALINGSSPAVPIDVIYKLTPTSTTGSCVGTTVDYTLTVNPKPVITSSATGTVCSGIAQSYAITSNVPSAYAWTRTAVTGITPATSSGTTASITETLTNSTSTAINVIYKITPTASTGTCVGTAFDYTVTVNPTPVVAATTASICSGAAQNHTITSAVASTYTWTRAAVTGITPATSGAGLTSSITEALTNVTNPSVPVDVLYSITPTSTTGSCIGIASTYTVTVNPLPVITSDPTGTICTAVAQNYLITSNIPSNFSWTRAAIPSINGGTAGSGTTSSITEILTSTATGPVIVRYVITPTSTTGACPGASFNYDVTVSATAAPSVTIAIAPNTKICANTPVTFTTTQSGGGTPTYKWTSDKQAGTLSTTDNFSSSSLIDGEVITVEITSSLGCAVPKTATSSVTMNVDPIPVPAVSLVTDKTTICPDEEVIFTATPTDGGTAPKYVWKDKAGAVITGETNATYKTSGLTTANNEVTVEMTSTALCAPTAAVASLPAGITIKPTPAPAVTVVSNITNVCEGNPVTFTATPADGGIAPTYEWFIGTISKQGPSGNDVFTTNDLTVSTSSPGNAVTVKMISNADCASGTAVTSAPVTITVNPGVNPGSAGTDTEICYGTSSPKLVELTPSTAATPIYTWQQTDPLDPANWITANGTPSNGGKDFTPSDLLTSDISYRRKVEDASAPIPCNEAYTTPVKITVSAQVLAGAIDGDEGLCENALAGPIVNTSLPTGGQGTFTYVWESSTVPSPSDADFSPILPAAIGIAYNPGNLSVTTYYRRKEINSCKTVYSNDITKIITQNTVVSVTTTNPVQTCTGNPITITATPTGGGISPSYEWFKGDISVGTGDTYTFTPASSDNSKEVIVKLTSSEQCNTGVKSSAPVTLDIIDAQAAAVTIEVDHNPNCAGLLTTFSVKTITAGGGNPGFTWYVNGSASGTDETFSTASLVDGDQVWVEMLSNLPCVLGANPVASAKIKVNIKPIPDPKINEGDQTICSPKTFTFHATVGSGTTYQWMRDGKAIPGATNATYTATQSGVYTLNEDNGVCNQTSAESKLTVIQTPIAYAGEDIYIKEGSRGQLFGAGGALYTWTPSTGLSDPNVYNPTFVAENTTAYTLTVADPTNTCKSKDAVVVYVEKQIRIPNVITVNGDGNNDTWEIENIESYPNAEFLIYNRWGNLVWKQEGNSKKWDGTNFRNGEVLPDGTYFYIITLNSQIYNEPYTGWIQIVK